MSNLSVIDSQVSTSPFDAIRHVDETGKEFWVARELMPVLGYPRWNEFRGVIDKAMAACKNTGNTVVEHFSGSTQKSRGRDAENYELSRYGSYLVAMNGDPRKPEIAAAQSYFAVKTHEAETQVQSMTQIQALLVAVQQMAAIEQRQLEQERANQEIQKRLQAIEAEQDRYQTPSGHKFTILGYANIQGLQISGAEAASKGKRASALCKQQGFAIERIHDPRFGRVGLYPESVLIEVFK